MGLRGRLVCAALGAVLLGAGVWFAVAEPVERLSDALVLLLFLSWGLAGLLFPLADPGRHDAWWRVCATLATVPVVAGMVVLGPLGVLAPELVADPDSTGKWPRTPDRAVVVGWFFLAAEALLVLVLLSDRRNRRQVDRSRRR